MRRVPGIGKGEAPDGPVGVVGDEQAAGAEVEVFEDKGLGAEVVGGPQRAVLEAEQRLVQEKGIEGGPVGPSEAVYTKGPDGRGGSPAEDHGAGHLVDGAKACGGV